jgi:RNA polymerase sigma-70 factor (ECF subfamily)
MDEPRRVHSREISAGRTTMENPSLPAPEILLAHGEALRRLGRALLGDAHLAEDLVQETLVRRIEHASGPVVDERGWLRVVLRNLGLNVARRRSAAADRERSAARDEALPSAADEAARAELLRHVVDAVLALDEPYRATILARYVRGLEARELAESQAIPLATVRSREQRALEKLRRKLDRAAGERSAWSTALVSLVRTGGSKGASTVVASATTKVVVAASILLVCAVLAGRVAQKSGSPPEPGSSTPTFASSPTTADPPTSARSSAREQVARASDKTLHVSGRLVDLPYPELSLPGGPTQGVDITVIAGKIAWTSDQDAIEGHVLTDEAGRFELELADRGERPLSLRFSASASDLYRQGYRTAPVPEGTSSLEDVQIERAAHGILHGVTVDRDGAPLAGVLVRFLGPDKEAVQEVVSDEAGNFRVESLGPHTVVQAESAGRELLDYTVSTALESGGWTPMRITLASAGRLRLSVLGPAGKPLADVSASVSLAQAEVSESTGGGFGSSTPTLSATTDEAGTALFDTIWNGARLEIGLALGKLRATARGRQGDELLFDAGPGEGSPIVAEVGEDLELVARLVTLDVPGIVVHADGSAVPHPRIVAFDDDDATPGKILVGSCEGDANGKFHLSNLVASLRGPLRIVATDGIEIPALPGWTPIFGPPLDSAPPGTSAGVFILPPGDAVAEEDVRIVLEPLFEISGRVLDPAGIPVPLLSFGGARLFIASAGEPHYASGPFGRFAVHTGSDGAFRVWVPQGLFDAFVLKSFGRYQRFPDIPSGSTALELRLRDDAEAGPVNLRVRAAGGTPARYLRFLQARFFPREADSFPKAPASRQIRVTSLAGWPVDAPFDFGGFSGAADALGQWEFGVNQREGVNEIRLPTVETGWYVIGIVTYSDSGNIAFPMATECLWFDAGEYTIDFELVPTTKARGRILADGTREFLAVELCDSSGRSLPLRAHPGYGTPVRFLETDARGEFLLQDVPVGSFLLRAGTLAELASGTARTELPIELVAGENPPLEIRF